MNFYYPISDDLTVIDWNSAFVFEPSTVRDIPDLLEFATAHLLDSVDQTVLKLLADAGVAAGEVDTVFFTGGSSGVIALRERIGALLPAARKVEGDLFGSIGAGLAIDAARKFGPGGA